VATKNNPGKFDCYENAKPDEPMFILLGRDPTAWLLVRIWCALRDELGTASDEQIEEAQACADALREYAGQLGKRPDEMANVYKSVMGGGAV
jgi:hypothetical protein